jgi:hypothetical protein
METVDKGYIQVRMSPNLKMLLKTAAESRGIQPTELIRFLVLNCYDRDREEVRSKARQGGIPSGD